MFWGKKISEIDIWRKPGKKGPPSRYRERLYSSHADPTANTAIANVMREEQELRKRRLRQIIDDERESRRILQEKRKDEARRMNGEAPDA